MRSEKEVADDIAKMCFRKAIEKQKESYDLLNFDCKEVSNFVRGEAFAYSKMNGWIQGYILNMCESDDERKEK